MTQNASVSVIGPTAGEIIHLGSVQMRILEDGHTTNHRFGLVESTLPPHFAGPVQHRHTQHDEGFYVVSGTARFTVGTTTYDAPAGTLVMVPPGVPHAFDNPADQPVILLCTLTPDLYVQYFRDQRDLIASGKVTPEAVAQLMSRYATVSAADEK